MIEDCRGPYKDHLEIEGDDGFSNMFDEDDREMDEYFEKKRKKKKKRVLSSKRLKELEEENTNLKKEIERLKLKNEKLNKWEHL